MLDQQTRNAVEESRPIMPKACQRCVEIAIPRMKARFPQQIDVIDMGNREAR
ncbi:hypothetical protein [Desulfitobacterium sp. AusDCA]|uniref:hypothetical protein n=1 Tax=Desulfitobacterium sp. AusDCA TaxID=3240383 RepID=UPI003DA7330D